MKDTKTTFQENILKMPYRPKVSDAEITSLFLGLCRLVKQQAKEEAIANLRKDGENNIDLCKEIKKKNKEIEMLRMINFELKKKIDSLILKNNMMSKINSSSNE